MGTTHAIRTQQKKARFLSLLLCLLLCQALRNRLVWTVVHHLAVDQGNDAVGIQRQFPVVGDQHQGLLVFPAEPHHQLHDLLGGPGVQVAGRLVGKDNFWLCPKRPCNADALLLSTGHLRRLVAHAPAQSHLFENLLGAPVADAFGDAPKHQRHRHIFQRAVGLQQVVGLEDKADIFLPELCKLAL